MSPGIQVHSQDPFPPCCPVSEVHILDSSDQESHQHLNVFNTNIFMYIFTMGKSKKSSLPSLDPSDARQLSPSVWEKAVMKKALNAILFIAAAWALNTGTHSFEEAEGGGTLAKWIHLCEPVNTNSSFKKHRNFTETTRLSTIFSNWLFRWSILILLVNNFASAARYIYLASVLEEALSSASCDSTSDSLLNHLSK